MYSFNLSVGILKEIETDVVSTQDIRTNLAKELPPVKDSYN